MRNKEGISIVETLVVITIFALLGAVVAQSVALSLRGARKTDALANVRDNLDFALSTLDRKVRNAREIVSTCDGSPINISSGMPGIEFKDEDGLYTTAACVNPGVDGYISSGGERLTDDNVSVISCQFICIQESPTVPPRISISVEGNSKNSPPDETSNIILKTTVGLRVY